MTVTMKHLKRYLLILSVCLSCMMAAAQSALMSPKSLDVQSFTFAVLSDTHLSPSHPQNEQDLRKAVSDINNQNDIAFVLLTGDLCDRSDTVSLQTAKAILATLKVPYYVIPGNHDTRYSNNGDSTFVYIFGATHFRIFCNGLLLLGFSTAPVDGSNIGHIQPHELAWLAAQMKQIGRRTPLLLITHFPLKEGDVDNWQSVTTLARAYNTQAFVGGHYHRNMLLDCDGVPMVLCRTTQRGEASTNGYTICKVKSDSITFCEKRINLEPAPWLTLPIEEKFYNDSNRAKKSKAKRTKQRQQMK